MSSPRNIIVTRSMARKRRTTDQSMALMLTAAAEEFAAASKSKPSPAQKPPAKQKPAQTVGIGTGSAAAAAKQKPASSRASVSSFGEIWTGKPALDLIHGPDFPSSIGPPQARAIVTRIIEGLKKRHETHELITQGRTLEYARVRFELDGTNIANHQHRLFRSFTQNGLAPQQGKLKLKLLHAALESELFYLVCWNRHAFPELTSHEEYSRLFPPLYPGNTTSMFAVLQADGLKFEALEPRKKSKCALFLFTRFLAHVQANASDSLLLRAQETPVSSPSQMQAADANGTSALKGQLDCEGSLTVPDRLLTLALTPETFYTALVLTIEGSGAGKVQYEEKVKEAVEAVMYRLAIKDPLSFPEVFSVVGETEGYEREGGEEERKETQGAETFEELSERLHAVRLVQQAVGRVAR